MPGLSRWQWLCTCNNLDLCPPRGERCWASLVMFLRWRRVGMWGLSDLAARLGGTDSAPDLRTYHQSTRSMPNLPEHLALGY